MSKSVRALSTAVAIAAITGIMVLSAGPAQTSAQSKVGHTAALHRKVWRPRILDFRVPRHFIHFAKDANAAASGLPTWTGSFVAGGQTGTYTMLGSDPAGGQSTTLPVAFVPLIFKVRGVTFDPTQNVNQFNANAITLLEQSPLFTPYPLSAGPTDLGTTQYMDAFMRANFWGSAATNGYHLMLGQPSVTAPVTINVPFSKGQIQHANNPPYNSTVANVSINYFQRAINKILAQNTIGVSPNQLVLFVYYNVFFYQFIPQLCCVLGFHSQDGNITYGTTVFNDPGIFPPPGVIDDIAVATHEIGEAIDDPTGNNSVPAWGNIGQVTGCQNNLEVGDPVTGLVTTIQGTNSFTYHPEDLVFANWFTRTSPSTSANGWYTLQNNFSGTAKTCPPGGSN